LTDTLYDRYVALNEGFMRLRNLKIIKVAGVYTSTPMISIHAIGFGLPEDSVLLRDQRLDLLESRYIDPQVWETCYQRYLAAPKGVSHTFLFNRTGDRPKAGGCLLSIVMIREGKGWRAMVTSRAIEATMAMLADIAFVRRCLVRLSDDLGLALDLERLPVSWHIGIVHQNRVFVPVFFFDVFGAAGLKRWLRRRPRSEWELICQEHTVKMMNGDGVTGARASWGRRLAKWCA